MNNAPTAADLEKARAFKALSQAMDAERAAAMEECAKWHDEQAVYWKGAGDSAYSRWQEALKDASRTAEYTFALSLEHEADCRNRIIHEHSAMHFRALAGTDQAKTEKGTRGE